MITGLKICCVSRSAGLLIGSLAVFVLQGAVATVAAADPSPSIRYVKASGVFELGPFPSGFADRLTPEVRLANVFSIRIVADDPERAGMAGAYSWTESAMLRFVPRFPLVAGLAYEVRFLPGGLPAAVRDAAWLPQTETVTIAEGKLESPTEVTAIYPTAYQLPENLLKFYLHFSRPMSRGEAYRHIQLLDANGEPVDLPFLELGEELWDAEQRRFTLFFDPGRVKRGLKPHAEAGRPLQAGERYTLVVKSAWKDAQRKELAKTARKAFSVTAADYTQPDPETWKLILPKPETKAPLKVQFGEPLDHALLGRVLWIEGAEGERVAGEARIGKGEVSWEWVPEAIWKKGEYAVVVDSVLEDLAGNSVGRPFEETGRERDNFGSRKVRVTFWVGRRE